MGNRYKDWYRQAEADLNHARHSLADGDYEWSCFAAHQAAEKALKSVFMKRGTDAWGHTIIVLVGNLLEPVDEGSGELIRAGRILDKFYIPTRYPNGFDSGAPTDYYTSEEAETAIHHAEVILEYCNLQIS